VHIDSIEELLDAVRTGGAMALEIQRRMGFVEKRIKADGSPVTAADGRVEDYLYAQIARRWPGANILTEEAERPFDPGRPYTFAVDPIDGTDVYSQGMAGWCLSIGLLDEDLRPVAGIVYAPRLDLLFFADVGKEAVCPGYEILAPRSVDLPPDQMRLMASSRIYQELDLLNFPGKAWGLGSAALHFCFPLIYPDVVGSLQHSGIFVWDVAGAHAINMSRGLIIEYWSGAAINYQHLTRGGAAPESVVSGFPVVIEGLRTMLTRR
jgi:myo-inositol-1(or 4)-monophosphatase